jgi:hypothetical protein
VPVPFRHENISFNELIEDAIKDNPPRQCLLDKMKNNTETFPKSS